MCAQNTRPRNIGAIGRSEGQEEQSLEGCGRDFTERCRFILDFGNGDHPPPEKCGKRDLTQSQDYPNSLLTHLMSNKSLSPQIPVSLFTSV